MRDFIGVLTNLLLALGRNRMNEPLSCPFCGGIACVRPNNFLWFKAWEIFCWKCGASLPSNFDTKEQAIAVWNDRTYKKEELDGK